MNEDTDALVDDAKEQAEFGAGFDGDGVETTAKEKPEPAETPREEEATEPEHVKITAKEWAEIKAAAAKTASYDQQLSRLFGTTGNLQKLLNESKTQPATPTGRKIEIPKAAFADMEKDFPELAQQVRASLEAALSGLPGTGANDVDPGKIEAMLASYTSKREVEILDDAHPGWREIVGAVSSPNEPPNPDNAFRKWLATKDENYQTKVNGTESATVIGRAIRLFQNETQATPKPSAKPRDEARADRIRNAVQPRGDNAPAPAGKSDDDEFLAGFAAR